jgi:hypothetical protein
MLSTFLCSGKTPVDICVEKNHTVMAEFMRFPDIHSELAKKRGKIIEHNVDQLKSDEL